MFSRMALAATHRPHAVETLRARGGRAHALNTWVVSPRGWLCAYPGRNVAVFDYFGILTGGDPSGLSRYATGVDGSDSHPSRAGNTLAAAAFVPFFHRALRRAGLGDELATRKHFR
jgi:hypothetical protein